MDLTTGSRKHETGNHKPDTENRNLRTGSRKPETGRAPPNRKPHRADGLGWCEPQRSSADYCVFPARRDLGGYRVRRERHRRSWPVPLIHLKWCCTAHFRNQKEEEDYQENHVWTHGQWWRWSTSESTIRGKKIK